MRHETCVFPGVLHTVILVLNANKYQQRLPTENVNKITGLIYRYKRCTLVHSIYLYSFHPSSICTSQNGICKKFK